MKVRGSPLNVAVFQNFKRTRYVKKGTQKGPILGSKRDPKGTYLGIEKGPNKDLFGLKQVANI